MRGEYIPVLAPPPPAKGSPPLARGIPPIDPHRTKDGRITPACAGNTRENVRRITSSGDHPRLRGEYQLRRKLQEVALGSPPLARGIHLDFLDFVRAVRITPACAGNTLSPKNKGRQTEDHPRLRGEYKERAKKSRPSWGSPPLARGIPPTITNVEPISGITPLARGIHVCGVKHNKRPRITPACAGNTTDSR